MESVLASQTTPEKQKEAELSIPPGEELRWLPIEVVAEEQIESFLAALDEACAIPKPRSIAHRLVA